MTQPMRTKARFTIRGKLALTVGTLVATIAIVGGTGLLETSSMRSVVGDLTATALPANELLLNIDRDLQQAVVGLHTAQLLEGADRAKQLKDYETNLDQVRDRWGQYKALPLDSMNLATKWTNFDRELQAWTKIGGQMAAYTAGGTPAELAAAKGLIAASSKQFEAAREVINGLQDVYHDYSVAHTQEAADREARARLVILLISGVGMVGGLALGGVIAHSVVGSLATLTRRVQDLTEGEADLRQRITVRANDETADLAHLLNRFLDQIAGVVSAVGAQAHDVADAARQLTTSSGEVSQAAQSVGQAIAQVADGATVQSRAVEETTGKVTELRHSIEQIAGGAREQSQSARQAAELAGQMVSATNEVTHKARGVSASAHRASDTARSGSAVVERTIAGIEHLRETVTASAERIRALDRLSAQIGAITKAITEIADQTSMLALNAAIEAARAGEHGKGFAVVADEVRKLADRAGRSATEIAGLVQSIQAGTAAAVQVMDQGTQQAAEGSHLAADAGSALQEIRSVVEMTTADAESISAAVEQIAAFSREMSKTVQTVAAISTENTGITEQMSSGAGAASRSISAITRVTQENAATAEEVSASVEEMAATMETIAGSADSLSQAAERLRREIGRFKL